MDYLMKLIQIFKIIINSSISFSAILGIVIASGVFGGVITLSKKLLSLGIKDYE